MIKSLSLVFFSFLIFKGSLFSQKSIKIEQIENELIKTKNIPDQLRLHANLCFEYSEIDTLKSFFHLNEAKKLLPKNTDDSLYLHVWNAEANYFYANRNYNKVKENQNKVIELGKKLNKNYWIGTAYFQISSCYRSENKSVESIKYLDLAMDYYEKAKNKRKYALALKEKGSLLIQSKSFDAGRKIFKECLNKFSETKDTLQMGKTYGSIGWSFRQESKNDSAIYYMVKAANIFEKLKNYELWPIIVAELGKAYADKNDHIKALEYYNMAENRMALFKNKTNRHADALNNFKSQSLIALKRYKEALPYAEKAQKLAVKDNDEEEIADTYFNLGRIYKYLGKYQQSIYQFEKYDSLRYKIEDDKQRNTVADVLEKYQSEKKEQQIKLQQSEISKKNQLLIGAGILAGLLVFLGYTFYKRRKMEQEAKLQAEVLNQQTLATQAVLDGEERERKRIAADLHDGVGQTIMALKMNLLGINDHIEFKSEKAKEIFEKAVDLASESAKEVRTISHQMMPNALIKSGLASAIREFLQNIDLQNLKINLEVNNLNEPLEPTTEKVLYRVIQELVNNVIKHAKANILNISIDKKDQFILAKIEDNGQGFDSEQPDFEGIGLKNIKDRIAFLKGDIKIESAKNLGTKVLISIPIA